MAHSDLDKKLALSQREAKFYKTQVDTLAKNAIQFDIKLTHANKALATKDKAISLIAELLYSSSEHDETFSLLKMSIEKITMALDIDRAVLLMPNEDGAHFSVYHAVGLSQQEVEEITEVPLSNVLAQDSISALGLIANKNVHESPLIAYIRYKYHLPYFILAPVMEDGKIIAIFITARLREDYPLYPPLNDVDLDALTAVSNFIAVTIKNLKLYEEARRKDQALLEEQNLRNQILKQLVDERTAEINAIMQELEEKNKMLEDLSNKDPLTGLLNRRSLDSQGRDIWRHCYRKRRPISVLLVDIDHFKHINDGEGHDCGDYVLVQFSKIMKNIIGRPFDLLVRYGGEEFLIVLPETDSQGAARVSKKLLTHTENQSLTWREETFHITVSIGYDTASADKDLDRLSHLISRADKALYHAKESGRNRACCFDELF